MTSEGKMPRSTKTRIRGEKASMDKIRSAIELVTEGNMTVYSASKFTGVARSTIKRYLDHFRSTGEELGSFFENNRTKKVFSDGEEKLLVNLIKTIANSQNSPTLHIKDIRELAYKFATQNQNNYPPSWDHEQMTSEGWARAFRKKYESEFVAGRLENNLASNKEMNVSKEANVVNTHNLPADIIIIEEPKNAIILQNETNATYDNQSLTEQTSIENNAQGPDYDISDDVIEILDESEEQGTSSTIPNKSTETEHFKASVTRHRMEQERTIMNKYPNLSDEKLAMFSIARMEAEIYEKNKYIATLEHEVMEQDNEDESEKYRAIAAMKERIEEQRKLKEKNPKLSEQKWAMLRVARMEAELFDKDKRIAILEKKIMDLEHLLQEKDELLKRFLREEGTEQNFPYAEFV